MSPNISFKFKQIYNKIEEIISSKEITELCEFNKDSFINNLFRKSEQKGVYNVEYSDRNFENAGSEAEEYLQNLCSAAERYLRDLLDNIKDICED